MNKVLSYQDLQELVKKQEDTIHNLLYLILLESPPIKVKGKNKRTKLHKLPMFSNINLEYGK